MKLGVATSTVIHAGLIGLGMLSVSTTIPEQVNINLNEVSGEFIDVTDPVKGEKEAEIKEVPAPKKTEKKEEPKPEAKNEGDSKSDEKSEAKEKPAEKAVEKAATVKETEPEVKEPEPEKIEEAEPEPDESEKQIAALPKNIAVPTIKPKIKPKPKPTEAKKDKKTSVGDLIKNNKTTEKAASGGAKSSNQQASLGQNTDSFAERLSRREEDNLISRISRCSTGQAGQLISDDLRVTIVLELNKDGTLKINPKGKAKGGTEAERRRFTRDALRYSVRCAPYDFLPVDKYDTWKEIVVTFHPSKMFE